MATAYRLALLHAHQRDVPIAARERLAAALTDLPPAPDRLVLATCHRVELYAAITADAEPRAALAASSGLAADDPLFRHAACSTDLAAARHLLRVACGLDSAVRGEAQILTQLRRVFDEARVATPLHPVLTRSFQRALHLGRELRATSALGEVRRSVGSLAVDEAVRLLGDPMRATVLVIGAGEVGKLAARTLARRVGTLLIANRDRARAEEVAELAGAGALGLDAVPGAILMADAVISAADTRGALLTAAVIVPRCARRPLVLIDIAVPRSVDATARAAPGLVYRDVDDIASSGPVLADEVVAEAERRCAEEAAKLVDSLRVHAAAATIRDLHDEAEALRKRQLARALAKLGHLGERDRRVVEALSGSLTRALLHRPTLALRERPERDSAARELFGLGGDGP